MYRSPLQIMQAWEGDNSFAGAPCTRSQRNPPAAVCRILREAGIGNCRTASPAQYCAASLARMADTALGAHRRDLDAATAGGKSRGLLLDYSTMPGAALPPPPGGESGGTYAGAMLKHAGLLPWLEEPATAERQRRGPRAGRAATAVLSPRDAAAMHGTADQYSKQGHASSAKKGLFTGALAKHDRDKDERASGEVLEATRGILEKRHALLQEGSKRSLELALAQARRDGPSAPRVLV